MRALGFIFLALSTLSCSKKSREPERKEPWLAQSAASGAPSTHVAHYRVAPRCQFSVTLKAREATPKGTFRVCKGELDVDLADLTHTHGKIAIDVASIEMESDADGGRSDDYTSQAQNWFDVGSSRPEAERERLRWATFELSAVEEPSSPRAEEGKRVRETEDAGDPTSEGDAGPEREVRAVDLAAKGSLELHDVRVELSLPVRVSFEYADKASSDREPERISIETRRPVAVALEAHDIKPRNAEGVFVAEGTKLLGSKVGREARVAGRVVLSRTAR